MMSPEGNLFMAREPGVSHINLPGEGAEIPNILLDKLAELSTKYSNCMVLDNLGRDYCRGYRGTPLYEKIIDSPRFDEFMSTEVDTIFREL